MLSKPGHRLPIDPAPTRWQLPSPDIADDDGIIGIGGDLEPGTLLAAYRCGLFPMPYGRKRIAWFSPDPRAILPLDGLRVTRSLRQSMPYGRKRIAWFSPDPRAILPLDGLRVTRSLRQSMRRYTITHDTAFADVMLRCGDPRRPGSWINAAFVQAYTRLHTLGWAHSFECRDDDGRLVGGLYGVRIGGFFAGESMFHLARDASKVALTGLVDWLNGTDARLLDVQWPTPHLTSIGAITVDRNDYLQRLAGAVE